MESTEPDTTIDTAGPAVHGPGDADAGVEDELLIEEISIDGMCGVY